MPDFESENRLRRIAGCQDLEQLKSIRIAEQQKLEEELHSSDSPLLVNRLNKLHDGIISKAVHLAENDLARKGHGAPPVPYAYLLFGSGGRSEQTMHSDQDSGLVYADSLDAGTAERSRTYFTQFSEAVVDSLLFLGYPLCEGKVLSSNADWRMTLDEWRNKLDGWFADPSWESVRYLLITADARAVTGDTGLAAQLQEHFYNELANHPSIAGRMLENTLRHKVLVGFFGQLLPERYGSDAGTVDIKYGAYIPMVNAFRLLAVREGIRATGTLERIEKLQQARALSSEEAEEARQAFAFVLKMRLIGKIIPAQLGRELTVSLKESLKAGRKIQSKLQGEMKHRFGGR
ncbi:hypothetical protein SD71_04325 [Cohnella kolymensis]|uniref:Signal transduction protein n=1 Tax=Cohnella kolymensis TaxID=1590652 RepID=A0ABR5A799_9BACL|nr:DUF294 nucleotidyltransferase-like domain-containing protein [Cohnella kolymensis]KIL36945.1 hypothetical protein SD71_04325 [Cohnella kolymensis]